MVSQQVGKETNNICHQTNVIQKHHRRRRLRLCKQTQFWQNRQNLERITTMLHICCMIFLFFSIFEWARVIHPTVDTYKFTAEILVNKLAVGDCHRLKLLLMWSHGDWKAEFEWVILKRITISFVFNRFVLKDFTFVPWLYIIPLSAGLWLLCAVTNVCWSQGSCRLLPALVWQS